MEKIKFRSVFDVVWSLSGQRRCTLTEAAQ